MKKPKISIISAIGENRELGKKNDLIWRIKDDLQRVKNITTGHPIIMGQNTYKSIGRPLPNRTNIVLTRDTTYTPTGCITVHSLAEALEQAEAVEDKEIFIFGGAYVYEQTIKIADRLYLTLIHDTDTEADVFFPKYDEFSKIIKKEEREQEGLKYDWLIIERPSQ